MPIQQDQLVGQLTGITFEDINNLHFDKLVHNGSDFFICKLSSNPTAPVISYYTTDGDKATSYAFDRHYIFDVDVQRNTGKYFQLRHVLDEVSSQTMSLTWSDDFSNSNLLNTRWFWPYYSPGNPSIGHFYYSEVDENIYVNNYGNNYFETNKKLTSRLTSYNALDVGGLPNPAGFDSTIDYSFDRFYNQNTSVVYNSTAALTIINEIDSINPYISDYKHTAFIASNTTMSGGYYGSVVTSGYRNFDSSFSAYIDSINISMDNLRNLYRLNSTSPNGTYDLNVTISASMVSSYVTELSVFHNGVLDHTMGANTDVEYRVAEGIRPRYSILLKSTTPGGIFAPSGTTWDCNISFFTNQDTSLSGTLKVSRDDDYLLFNPDYPTVTGYSINRLQPKVLAQVLENVVDKSITFDNYTITQSGVKAPLEVVEEYVLTIEEINEKGQYQSTVVDKLDILPDEWKYNKDYAEFFNHSNPIGYTKNPGRVLMAIDDNNGAFVKVLDDVYRINLAGTYSPSTYYDESSPNIAVSSGIMIATGVNSYQFNFSGGNRFLQYLDYDEVTTEVRLKTMGITGSGSPTYSPREVFLLIPDFREDTDITGTSNRPVNYHTCLHGTDNNTLFYFRKHGVGEVNSIKSSGTNGAINATLFTSTGATFITSGVKPGDTVKMSGGSLSGVQKATVVTVVSNTSLILNRTFTATTVITFSIASNAVQIQFNLDSTTAAFASLNALDFSLRAGTADNTLVRAEVIDCWGEPLSGKSVNFAVIQGDGVVDPPSAFTNASGIADTTYYVGSAAGQVLIQATITD